MIMTVERSNPTVCAPTRRVPRPQGVRRRLAISVPPSPEERQQASVKRFRPTVPAIAIGGTGRPAFEAASRPGCCGGGRRVCPSPTSLGCGGFPGRSATGDVVSGARHRAGRVSALAAERSGRRLERGRLDAVIAGLLFMAAGMRRSEVSALRWADVADAADGDGVLVTVRRSKTNQEGEVRGVRFVKGGVARAIRTLRAAANPAPAARVVPLSPKMVGLQFQAAARAAGIEQ